MNLKTALLLGLSWQLLHMFKRKYFLLMDAYFQLKTIGADNLKPCTFSNHFLNWWLFYLWLRVIIDYQREEVYLNQSLLFMTSLQVIVVSERWVLMCLYFGKLLTWHSTCSTQSLLLLFKVHLYKDYLDNCSCKSTSISQKSVNNHKILHLFHD